MDDEEKSRAGTVKPQMREQITTGERRMIPARAEGMKGESIMDDPRQPSLEARESGETAENLEQQKLDDAAYEPRSLVEQTGDFRQAESIQNNLTALVGNAKPAEESVAAVPPHMPGEADRTKLEDSSGESGVDKKGAIPITVPDVQGSSEQTGYLPIPIPEPRGSPSAVTPEETVLGRRPQMNENPPEPAESGSGDTQDITPINLPNIRETVRQAEESVRQPTDSAGMKGEDAEIPAGLRQSSEQTGFKVDAGRMETVLRQQGEEAGFPKEGTGVIPTPLRRSLGETAYAEDTNMPADSETGEAPITTEAPETTEQDWTPPEMYASVGPDGKVTVVDADGNPVSSPPIITKIVDGKGVEKLIAVYPGSGAGVPFDIPFYSGSMQDCFAHVGPDGKVTVVDADGKPVNSQPVITKIVDSKGVEKFYASYPGIGAGAKVELSAYSASIEDCYAHFGPDGKVTVVDADGKPINGQPLITKVMDGNGVEKIIASYPGAAAKVELAAYSASLQGCYAHFGADGKVTVVDASGKPINGQPLFTKVMDANGVEKIIASYPGAAAKVELSAYSAPLQGAYAHPGPDGKMTVVDAYGEPINSQPVITKIMDSQGVEKFIASYPGTGTKLELPAYSASLQGCFAHAGQDGKITVVGADGKPLSSQPVITKIMDSSGKEQIIASYPGAQGGTKINLNWYLPPSSVSKPEPTRHR
jgi:hypothetical protein